MKRPLLFLAFIPVLLAGCGVLLKMYGMHKLRALNGEDIRRYAHKYGIANEDSHTLDTAKYMAFLRSIDTTRFALAQKNHAQPLQALYFDASGTLVSWQVNCYAGGFPNLHWERDSIFSVFPPKQQAPLDSFLTCGQLRTYLLPHNEAVQAAPDAGYTIVVFWNHWMGRQSERLIAIVQKNRAEHPGTSSRIVYVNNDNLYAGMDVSR